MARVPSIFTNCWSLCNSDCQGSKEVGTRDLNCSFRVHPRRRAASAMRSTYIRARRCGQDKDHWPMQLVTAHINAAARTNLVTCPMGKLRPSQLGGCAHPDLQRVLLRNCSCEELLRNRMLWTCMLLCFCACPARAVWRGAVDGFVLLLLPPPV